MPLAQTLHRRLGWRAGSSLSGVGLAVIGAVALTPFAASAADECGTGAVVTCAPTGNPYGAGIFYIPAGDQTINLQSGVKINTAGSLSPGLLVVQGGPTSSIVINGGAGVSIATSDPGAFGALLATNAGAITASIGAITTSGAYAEGLAATSASGPIKLMVGSVLTSGQGATGVDVLTGSSGIAITAGSVVTQGAGAIGVSANGGGAVGLKVDGAGVTSAQATAVSLSGATVDVVAAAGSVIQGATDGIKIQSTSGATLNLAGTVSSSGGFAIDAAGGLVSVSNTGTVNGAVQLLGGGDRFANSGTFNATANSAFAASDVFTNTGTLNVAPGASGNVTFSGLGTFNNAGLINLSNGKLGETFTLPGGFNGGAGSLLALDANLSGSAIQASCASAAVANCLILQGGHATGVTGIRVSNLGSGPTGFNTTGVVVIDAPGGSIAPGAFLIDPGTKGYETRGGQGAIASGFFFYHLAPVGTTQEALFAVPDVTAFQFVELGAAATDIWYKATGTWLDREGDLRRDGTDEGSAFGHPAVWLKISGSWTKRESSQSTTSAGTTYGYDTSYDQNTVTIIGGADLARVAVAGGGAVLGVDGGYVNSDLTFRGAPTYVNLAGGVIGGYASLFRGPWYLDGSITDTFLTLKDRVDQIVDPVTSQSLRTQGGVNSFGGQMETGFRLPFASAFMLEPLGSLAYVETHFDNLAIPGGAVTFKDVDSFRGSLGFRVSYPVTLDGVSLRPSLYARAWDEFHGSESTALLNPGDTVLAGDSFKGVFGDVGGQVSIFSKGGVSAFFSGDYKFKSNYDDYTASVGVRYQF
jgi:hypothetical protein